jgi:hypothetical protein
LGQYEVLAVLIELSKFSKTKFFTVEEIKKELKNKGCCHSCITNAHKDLCLFWRFGILELKANQYGIFDKTKQFSLK